MNLTMTMNFFDDFLRSAASGIGISIGTLSDAIDRSSKLARSKWQTNLKLRLEYARGDRSGGGSANGLLVADSPSRCFLILFKSVFNLKIVLDKWLVSPISTIK